MGHATERTLVVEDDASLAKMLALQIASTWPGSECRIASTLAEAKEALAWAPTLVLLDVGLPDGRGTDFLPDIHAQAPAPAVIAMSGQATAKDAFTLAAGGARAYLAKPIEFEELEDAINGVELKPLAPMENAKHLLGVASIHDVQTSVRRAMLLQALSLTGCNRTATARLLQVTRQAVQQMIRDLDIEFPTVAP